MMLIRSLTAILLFTALLPAQDSIGAGTYKGQWNGSTASGDFHLALEPDGNGGMTAKVGFTMESQEVPCKVLSLKITGSKLSIVYEFDLQGNKLQSAIEGAQKGKSMEGTYKTSAGDQPVDTGSWKVAAQ
jgi:hypothetical protein